MNIYVVTELEYLYSLFMETLSKTEVQQSVSRSDLEDTIMKSEAADSTRWLG